ncbi:MAG: cbb3-type cytochrome c oxidase subunit 3 [Alphaproteobacteria bacterium]
MMDWLAAHGGLLVLLMFFVIFLGFFYWAYKPANKRMMEDYGHIPMMENDDGE